MPKAARSGRNSQPTARSLEGWAIGLLIETHAICECVDHGHRRDRGDPDAWRSARRAAREHPLSGFSPQEAVAAIDAVMEATGETCPDCDR